MSALAQQRRPSPMRLYLDGLALVIGPAGTADGYRAVLDPDQARGLAAGLLLAADRAECDAQQALDQLDDIVNSPLDDLDVSGHA